MNVYAIGSQRNFVVVQSGDKRGEGVPITIIESEKLDKRRPEYRMLDESDLMLTIFAAQSPHIDATDD